MSWKTVREHKECPHCKCMTFIKVLTEHVSIITVDNFNKARESLGGTWDEKQVKEHKVVYTCKDCGKEV